MRRTFCLVGSTPSELARAVDSVLDVNPNAEIVQMHYAATVVDDRGGDYSVIDREYTALFILRATGAAE